MSKDKDIQKGFNKGYLLMKYKPELAKTITAAIEKDQSPFSLGLKAGIKEMTEEKTFTKAKTFDVLKTRTSSKSKTKKKSKDKDKDIGDLEK